MCIHERFQISIQNILDKYTSLNVGTCPSCSDWNVKILAWKAGVQFMTGYDGNGLSCSDTHHHLQTSWYEGDLVLKKLTTEKLFIAFLYQNWSVITVKFDFSPGNVPYYSYVHEIDNSGGWWYDLGCEVNITKKIKSVFTASFLLVFY